MKAIRWRQILSPLLLSIFLLISACTSAPPSPYEQVQEETTGRNAPGAVSDQAIAGSEFNQFFPASEGEFEVVPSQEKDGFAEYKLNRDGATVAMLSISDTVSSPDALAKFADSTRQVGGYPAVDVGSTQTAILVGDRFQVKVQSRDQSFTVGDREVWLEKFDLAGLAQLQS